MPALTCRIPYLNESMPYTATMLLASTGHYRDRRLPADVPKYSSLCPQGSIVGMMLEVPEPATIVKSRALVALSSMTLLLG